MISSNSIIETSEIGNNASISDFVVIRSNVRLGDNVVIHPQVVIESGVEIGNNVEIFPGAYLGKEPKGAGATARLPEFERRVLVSDNCSIGPGSIIYYDVSVGNNTLVGDHASIREKVTIGSFCIISRSVTINYNTHIGQRSKIMDMSHITGNCWIGDDVFISVLVSTTNDRAIGKQNYDEARIQGPRIHNHAAIGAGANLLPGVEIGEGAIVAASSVVTKDVSPYKMVAGSPARVIKSVDE